MSNNPEQFIPTELWTPDLSDSFQRVRAEINQENSEALLTSLKGKVERSEGGIVYAVLDGDEPGEYSEKEALVVFNTFAAAATPVALAKAEVIRRVAREAEITAEDGKYKPVIMLANPGIKGSKIRLSKEERSEVKGGDLGPIARELLSVIEQRDIGEISIYASSNGADLGLAASTEAYSRNLDLDSTSVLEPASTEQRSLWKLRGDFMKASSKSLKAELAESDVAVVDKAFGKGVVDFIRFGLSIPRPRNILMARAMGVNTFETRVQQILDDGKLEDGSLIIGYGDESAIAKPENIEPAMERLYVANGRDAFVSVRFPGEHTLGDNLGKVLYLVTRAAA